jgi:Zn-dependent M28 family amino/carboxypeptidase
MDNSTAKITGGEWCLGKPVAATASGVKPQQGVEYRGNYRDLSLWVEEHPNQVHECTVIARHGSDSLGLWVIEFMSGGDLAKELARAKAANVHVVAQQGLSLILKDGKKTVPDSLGYDACGEEKDFAVISVAQATVSGPRKMPAAEKAKFMARAAVRDEKIVSLLKGVSQTSLTDLITKFQNYHTRNSYSKDLADACEFVASEFSRYGFDVSRHDYSTSMPANVVAEFKGTGNSDKIIVVGAHFDSRSTDSRSVTQRAPGADDNGSGSAALIEFARIIHESGATFQHTLRLALFTGEEQGLLGSRALAREWATKGENVIAMFNADMIGYRQPGTTSTLGYMNRYVDDDLTEIAMTTSRTYVPELNVGITTGCCSDQQSFYENGFPSVGWFETATSSVVYPAYHRSNDLLELLDPDQIYMQASSAMASALVWAEPN